MRAPGFEPGTSTLSGPLLILTPHHQIPCKTLFSTGKRTGRAEYSKRCSGRTSGTSGKQIANGARSIWTSRAIPPHCDRLRKQLVSSRVSPQTIGQVAPTIPAHNGQPRAPATVLPAPGGWPTPYQPGPTPYRTPALRIRRTPWLTQSGSRKKRPPAPERCSRRAASTGQLLRQQEQTRSVPAASAMRLIGNRQGAARRVTPWRSIGLAVDAAREA